MPQQELQCPFCEQTSSRPQGLAAHIRSRHPKQYPRWLKTPSRFADAHKGTLAPEAEKPASEHLAPPQTAQREAQPSSPQASEANPTLDLLNQAHAQLMDRKKTIEADLARLTNLTKELETVNTQIQALEKTLGVFSNA